ncbi:ATP-binding cassette domain-containing protein [Klugiella xanthotipulae]|uniref:FHA modulated ABC efflux pump with fused ATPase and integral membrane subunit n=1 Tax=Klugiella xanthotipulae TaxID=244735 RepID=A0A543I642_9MICO|nr:FHA domain-containing protein [Klugiella xanthotipulae]TQM66011.1 FHA modulated ABC efflux pump with fused ATPase and integral membrane subunit [Klugiella xanthotipulae]
MSDAVLKWGNKELLLSPGESVNIGRGPECEIVIPERQLSRVHAVVYYADGWLIADRNSTNGTFVEGKAVDTHWLTDGTELRLGDPTSGSLLTVDLTGSPAEKTAPPSQEISIFLGDEERRFDSVDTVLIGRGPECDLVLTNPLVSRIHAVLHFSDGWFIRDNESRNGSYVGTTRIDAEWVGSGVEIYLGDPISGTRLRIEPTPHPVPAAELQPVTGKHADAESAARLASAGNLVSAGAPLNSPSEGSSAAAASLAPVAAPPAPGQADDLVGLPHFMPPADDEVYVSPVSPVTPARPGVTITPIEHRGGSVTTPEDAPGGPPPAASEETGGEGGHLFDEDIESTTLDGQEPQRFRAIPKTLETPPEGSTVLTIGTAADNTHQLNDVLVSRHHARLTETAEGFAIDDLRSLNGTYINGQLISSGIMREGDRLTVGHNDFVRLRGALVLEREAEPTAGGLEVDGLGYSLPSGKRLLRGVDLTARRGTLTAVIGPSGAGKSTLAKVLTGLVSPSQGSVLFDEFDVHDNYSIVSSRIGLVPQSDVLHQQLTLTRALTFAAELRLSPEIDEAARVEKVTHVMAQLGLTGHEMTRIDTLSGGQRKRASVALELLTEPSLLVLDEPTSGLDPALDRQVMLMLRELADGDRAVVVVTHSVSYLNFCDQVLVLSTGGMPAYCGPVSGLKGHFGTDDWADIFATITESPEKAYAHYRISMEPPQQSKPPRPRLSARPGAKRSGPTWLTQFKTVATRQTRLLTANPGYLSFLVALPFVMGALALTVPGSYGFTATDPHNLETVTEPTKVLALLIIGATFMGASISVRDLIGERDIFQRERAVGLSVSAYVCAKVFILGALAWLSTGIMLVIVLIGKNPPENSLVLPNGSLEMFVALGLASSTTMVLGLLISSLVKSSEQVMPVLIVVVMSQLVMHGGIIPVTGRAVLDQISFLMPARWGYGAAAAGIDIRALVPSTKDDWLWDHNAGVWWLSIGVLMLFSIIFAAGTIIRLTDAKRTRS